MFTVRAKVGVVTYVPVIYESSLYGERYTFDDGSDVFVRRKNYLIDGRLMTRALKVSVTDRTPQPAKHFYVEDHLIEQREYVVWLDPPMDALGLEGQVVANGSEQLVIECFGESLTGLIDLSAMESGDVVVVSAYVKVIRLGNYKRQHRATYTYDEVKDDPVLNVDTPSSRYGARLTLQQVAGTPKRYPYHFTQ